jgi:hypothetical protein
MLSLYASVCTITGPATAIAGRLSSGTSRKPGGTGSEIPQR